MAGLSEHGRGFLRGLAVAAVGGLLFRIAGVPAPWLAGAMVATTAAALVGLQLSFPGLVRQAVFVLIGVQIGAGFTPETAGRLGQWPVSLALLALSVAAVTWAGYQFFHRACGGDRLTAGFAASPGALSLTLLLAERERADLPRIAVVQCIRLFFLVVLLPAVITGLSALPVGTEPAGAVATALDTVLMLAAGIVAGLLADRLRIPAGLMIGAAAAVAGLQITGTAAGVLPDWVLVPAFILLGLMIGTRFSGFTPWLLVRLMGAGLAGFLVAVTVAAAMALAATAATGIPLILTLIAFAPGGLEAMTIVALALGLDPAYVGTHQIARYLGLSLALPLVANLLGRLPRE